MVLLVEVKAQAGGELESCSFSKFQPGKGKKEGKGGGEWALVGLEGHPGPWWVKVGELRD